MLSRGRAWWHTPVIAATQEAEIGRSWFETSQGKIPSPSLKDKLKADGLKVWLKW
jgi:hypothetical protein